MIFFYLLKTESGLREKMSWNLESFYEWIFFDFSDDFQFMLLYSSLLNFELSKDGVKNLSIPKILMSLKIIIEIVEENSIFLCVIYWNFSESKNF